MIPVMQKRTNQIYWDLVQQVMDDTCLNQKCAEHHLVLQTILKYHRQGFSTHTIAKRLHQQWGLDITTYYRRLAKARRTICIP